MRIGMARLLEVHFNNYGLCGAVLSACLAPGSSAHVFCDATKLKMCAATNEVLLRRKMAVTHMVPGQIPASGVAVASHKVQMRKASSEATIARVAQRSWPR